MGNVDQKTVSYRDRLQNLEDEKRRVSEDMKELAFEMKSVGNLTKEEIAGIKLSVKRSYETNEKRQFRETVEDVAASLGQLAGTPLADSLLAQMVG